MIAILEVSYEQKRKRGGRKSSLYIEEMLLMTLGYLREYRTYFHIANSYGISESYAYKLISWVENELIKSREFSLPGKKALYGNEIEYDVIIIDATESPIERPQKKQRQYYSGKKKKHTLKTQVVVDKNIKRIICTEFCKGKKHDFRLFKDSKVHIDPSIKSIVDTGFLGISKIHQNSLLPKKKSKKHPLTKQDKAFNKEISSDRVVNEHVIGSVKRFKIISDKYSYSLLK